MGVGGGGQGLLGTATLLPDLFIFICLSQNLSVVREQYADLLFVVCSFSLVYRAYSFAVTSWTSNDYFTFPLELSERQHSVELRFLVLHLYCGLSFFFFIPHTLASFEGKVAIPFSILVLMWPEESKSVFLYQQCILSPQRPESETADMLFCSAGLWQAQLTVWTRRMSAVSRPHGSRL